MFYGLDKRSGCKQAVKEAHRAQAQQIAEPAPGRVPVIGAEPLHCAITAAGTGACFLDPAACAREAEAAGVACEVRTRGWCFDSTSIAGVRPYTSCAASPLGCDARRIASVKDRTLTVTACASYAVAATSNAD